MTIIVQYIIPFYPNILSFAHSWATENVVRIHSPNQYQENVVVVVRAKQEEEEVMAEMVITETQEE